jgi:DMSO/TMAO reductase YedYZ molybdopterin-dependent catalytic subunit
MEATAATKRRALLGGAGLGLLWATPLALLSALAELQWGLPSPAYALFEWLARVLPSAVITTGIDLIVRVVGVLRLGATAAAAKQAEHVLAIAMFLALAALVGGLIGWALRRPMRRPNPLGAALGAVFGMLVGLAALSGASRSTALRALTWSVALLTVWGALTAQSFAATRQAPGATDLRRRRTLAFLLATSGVLTAASLGVLRRLGRTARTLAAKLPLADLLARTSGPAASPEFAALQRRPAPVPGTRPELTATSDFYRIDINLTPPRLDAAQWRLEVSGLVARPLSLSLEELRARPSISQAITLECISNPVAGDLISSAVFTGVRLKDVLAEAQVKPEAHAVFAQAADGFFETIVASDIADDRTLLVYAMNGVPLPAAHGFPLRVYIPNRYGMKQPKWITRIEAIADERPGYWVKRGWDREALVKTTAVIDATPHASGNAEVGGIAFAGARGIERVEVQIDDASWQQAALCAPPIGPLTWVQWRYAWQPTPGRHRVRVRAYDGRGQLQPVAAAPPHPAGASGVHEKWIDVAPVSAASLGTDRLG